MEFGSTEFKLRFDFLDGLMDIFVATYFPEWSKYGPWYGLAIYIEYLEGYPVEIPVRVAFPSKELEILSGILERYMDRLRNISRAGNYQESEKKLREIAVRVSERNWISSKEKRFDNTRNAINSENGKSNMEHSKPDNVLNDIQNHFHFLFEGGFRIHHTTSRNSAAWVVILKSDAFNVHITSDRSEISLAVTDPTAKNWFELFEVVYFVSNKKEFIGVYEDQTEYKAATSYRIEQFQRLATILHKYLGEISTFFTGGLAQNFERLQPVLMEARELYSKALNEKLGKMNLP